MYRTGFKASALYREQRPRVRLSLAGSRARNDV